MLYIYALICYCRNRLGFSTQGILVALRPGTLRSISLIQLIITNRLQDDVLVVVVVSGIENRTPESRDL